MLVLQPKLLMDRLNIFQCHMCLKNLHDSRALEDHLAVVHKMKPVALPLPETHCDLCSKTFDNVKSLKCHINKRHKAPATDDGRDTGMLCPLCDQRVKFRPDLYGHLTESHDITLCEEVLTFQTAQEFDAWKQGMEKETSSRFRLNLRRSTRSKQFTNYICTRQGFQKRNIPEDERKHKLKKIGSIKTGKMCPAYIQVEESEMGLTVRFTPTHLGHDHDVRRFLLTKEERMKVAGLLAQGLSVGEILKNKHVLFSAPEMVRLKNLTRSELYVVKNYFSRCNETPKDSEVACTSQIVGSLSSMPDSPVLYFKAQGCIDVNDILSSEDFCLILMTNFQREMFLSLGDNKLCIEGVVNINKQGFFLLILLVEDEHYHACPVAFCISNREDSIMCSMFFEILKSSLGKPVQPAYIVSDEETIYHKVWTEVMDCKSEPLLCKWHLLKKWRNHLELEVPNTQKCLQFYRQLEKLVKERRRPVFENELNAFLDKLKGNEDLLSFSEYFQSYAARPEVWAYSCGPEVSSSKKSEQKNIDKTAKSLFFLGRKHQRVDLVIYDLLKIVKDKSFEYALDVGPGLTEGMVAEIEEDHEKSNRITNAMISKSKTSAHWKVKSADENNVSYIVSFLPLPLCRKKCSLLCKHCKACAHMYHCKCPYNLIGGIMCEHIHACARSHVREGFHPEPSTSSGEMLQDGWMDQSSSAMDDMEEDSQPVEDIFENEEMFFESLVGKFSEPNCAELSSTGFQQYHSVGGKAAQKSLMNVTSQQHSFDDNKVDKLIMKKFNMQNSVQSSSKGKAYQRSLRKQHSAPTSTLNEVIEEKLHCISINKFKLPETLKSQLIAKLNSCLSFIQAQEVANGFND